MIPAKALAKVSIRLVPSMTPQKTFGQLRDYVMSITPKGIALEVRLIHSGEPVVVGTDNPFVHAATEAMRAVFNKDTVFVRGGGSIPVLHAPNEKFSIANFHRGTESIIRFLSLAGA